ncbi:hypothetical protein [Shinella sp.]|uniref:hypothetical protein n=1 Tax=Shinella sp. TaxID=1870904 RepID=UPI0029AA5F89|nr:hypothetical protein [Shinella sp.]MDX3977934.1 hypothetical protein [Shinella sp.]
MKATKHQYVYRHPKSPNYWYMRDIPIDVRLQMPPGDSGRPPSKWKESLGTAILRDAARIAQNKASEHNAVIALARADKHPSKLHAHLSEADRLKIEQAGGVENYLRWLNDRARTALELADEVQSWRDFADEELSPSESPDPDWLAGRTAALDAERREIERQLDREVCLIKEIGETPGKLHAAGLVHIADAASVNRAKSDNITLGQLVQIWKVETRSEAPEQYEYPVKLFEELNGTIAVAEITTEHVRSFRDALKKMPPASGGRFNDMVLIATEN